MTLVLTAIGVIFCIGLMLFGYFWPVLIGGFIGSFFGIAGFGGAVSGAIPGAIVGALIAIAFKRNSETGRTQTTERRNSVVAGQAEARPRFPAATSDVDAGIAQLREGLQGIRQNLRKTCTDEEFNATVNVLLANVKEQKWGLFWTSLRELIDPRREDMVDGLMYQAHYYFDSRFRGREQRLLEARLDGDIDERTVQVSNELLAEDTPNIRQAVLVRIANYRAAIRNGEGASAATSTRAALERMVGENNAELLIELAERRGEDEAGQTRTARSDPLPGT